MNEARLQLLKSISELLDGYESSTPSNNDVHCSVQFFDGVEYFYNGERMVKSETTQTNP
jgi:hypothetical protein